MDTVFRKHPPDATRQRDADRQVGSHGHVSRHIRHFMAGISTPPQAQMRHRRRIPLRDRQGQAVPACMARASNDERTYRDTASHMHWRKKVGRMARLCCQLNRSDIGGDRRNYLDENKKQTSAIGIALVNSEDYSTTIVFSNELIPLSVTTSTTNRYLPFSLATIDCDETVGSPDNPIGV